MRDVPRLRRPARLSFLLRTVVAPIIAALVLDEPGSATDTPPSPSNVPIILQFDSSTHDFFWCGHRVTSPAFCTVRNGALVINGFGPQTPDTTGREFRLGKRFGAVPMVARLHAEGLSYWDAVAQFSHAKAVAAYEVGQLHALHANRSVPERAARIRAGVDDQLVDVTKPITVDSNTVSMSFLGWQAETYPRMTSPPPVPSKKAVSTSSLLERTQRIEEALRRDGRTLVIANDVGTLVMMGSQATAGLAAIEEGLRSTAKPMAVRQKAARKMIPEPMMREIILAAEGGK